MIWLDIDGRLQHETLFLIVCIFHIHALGINLFHFTLNQRVSLNLDCKMEVLALPSTVDAVLKVLNVE
jgi:hypothetical protein